MQKTLDIETMAELERIAAAEYDMFALAEQLNNLEPGAGLGFVNENSAEIVTFLDSAAVIFPAMTAVLMASALIAGLFMASRTHL